jgi:hypothetical protein
MKTGMSVAQGCRPWLVGCSYEALLGGDVVVGSTRC